MKVSFIVDGEPVGKGRPRFTNKGHTYTPKKTVLSEEKVKTMYLSQCGKKRLYGSIRAVLSCFCKIPKSDTKKNRALKLDGKILPAKNPIVIISQN